jgi:uncharacterized protein
MTKQIAESCVSHNTQKLTSTLFSWTADPKYSDEYMNTFYNSVMALQSAHSGRCVYHLPWGSPRRKSFLKENDFRCCNGTTIEAFASLNNNIYFHSNSTLWVNLYVPSKVNWIEKDIVLEQTGNFPQSPDIEFLVFAKNKSEFTLNLFNPSWSKHTEVYINGEKQDFKVVPGSHISIDREWKDNDKIKLVFHYDFYIKAMPDDQNVIAIFYGPMPLAFENNSELILKGDKQKILASLSTNENNSSFQLLNNGATYSLRPFYEIEDEPYGVYATIRNY